MGKPSNPQYSETSMAGVSQNVRSPDARYVARGQGREANKQLSYSWEERGRGNVLVHDGVVDVALKGKVGLR